MGVLPQDQINAHDSNTEEEQTVMSVGDLISTAGVVRMLFCFPGSFHCSSISVAC